MRTEKEIVSHKRPHDILLILSRHKDFRFLSSFGFSFLVIQSGPFLVKSLLLVIPRHVSNWEGVMWWYFLPDICHYTRYYYHQHLLKTKGICVYQTPLHIVLISLIVYDFNGLRLKVLSHVCIMWIQHDGYLLYGKWFPLE